MKIACYQFNPEVGGIEHNISDLLSTINQAKSSGADIFLVPELAVTGYAMQDLILRPHFQKKINSSLTKFLEIRDIILMIAMPYFEDGKIYNSVFTIHQGKILNRYDKYSLPNYGVFDEKRYFTPGSNLPISLEYKLNNKTVRYSLLICEDIWQDTEHRNQILKDHDLVLVLNASPYAQKKHETRLNLVSSLAKNYKTSIVYVNQVGAEDGLVFDGASFAVNNAGEVIYQAPSFKTTLDYLDLDLTTDCLHTSKEKQIISQYPELISADYQALVLGLKDYCRKNNFKKIVLGLSGGVDSALVLLIAVDAVGAENVSSFMLYSQYTSQESRSTAIELANNMMVKHQEIDIMPTFETIVASLGTTNLNFKNLGEAQLLATQNPSTDLMLQNLQARIRGNMLMAFSNNYNGLLVNTSNKSEIALGYGTLYGDMAGGYAVLKDVYKTVVYKLVKYRDPQYKLVPKHIIERAPSAELKDNQEDQDTLPPYDLLDKILEQMIEHRQSIAEITAIGYDNAVVEYVAKTLFINEYKRIQLAVGTKITEMAFNIDWRYPITKKMQF